MSKIQTKSFAVTLSIFLILFFSSAISSVKPKLLWFDATANFERLSYPDSIRYYLQKAHSLGFTDAVVDVKPITGEVLYRSVVAPQMKEWNGFARPDTFDFLSTFITEAHKQKMRVHASLNIFSGGHNYIDRGIVYTSHPEWASIVYTDSGTFPITKVKAKYSAMLNPANPEIQNYEIEILKELVSKYPHLNGIILDRVRYDGICADFSPLSRSLFEHSLEKKIEHFPEDIFSWKKDSAGNTYRADGRYFKQWLEWRARVITGFMKKARAAVKNINPKISFGDYTGSWYPIYYEVGVNWASKKYDPSKKYSWATPTYKNTGYAELLDLFSSGNYYFEVTKKEVLSKNETGTTESGRVGKKEYWYSVEGACEITKEVLKNAVPVYGGLYVDQYNGHPEQFEKAIAMCLKKSDGLMIFDIVHIINNHWWDVLQRGIQMGESK